MAVYCSDRSSSIGLLLGGQALQNTFKELANRFDLFMVLSNIINHKRSVKERSG